MIKCIRGSHTAISVVYWLEPSREFVDTQLEEMKSLLRFDSPPETLGSEGGREGGWLPLWTEVPGENQLPQPRSARYLTLHVASCST